MIVFPAAPRRRLLSVAAASLTLTALLLAGVTGPARAQRSYPPDMEGTISEVYRTVGDVELNMYLCTPEGHSADDERPALVFFFGGGWRAGSPQQFLPHCRYLAERGMIGAVADYRVANRHGVTANEAVADAKSAVRWLRSNAGRLGVDPDRIGAAGGSAGGHLAAATATLPGHDPDPEGVSALPNALVLFNPATVLAPVEGDAEPTEEQRERFEALAERFGAPPESMSPYHHLRRGLPPTMIAHGTADETVPHSTAERFCEGLREHDVRCTLVSYADQGHGFFNYGRGEGDEKNAMYDDTVLRMDSFLYSLEWLDPKPNPDGTVRKRLTNEEILANVLAGRPSHATASAAEDAEAVDQGETPSADETGTAVDGSAGGEEPEQPPAADPANPEEDGRE